MTEIQSLTKHKLDHNYSIAGLRVWTDRWISVENEKFHADGSVSIVFTDQQEELERRINIKRNTFGQNGWLSFSDYCDVRSIGSRDGQNVIIYSQIGKHLDYGMAVRQVVPFASALQGKLILHASAVLTKDGVVAFIGESGVGKSTIAHRLGNDGYLLVADDLLPCRLEQGNAYVPILQGNGDDSRGATIASIYFLSRDSEVDNMVISPLKKIDHLRMHLRNGFGELPSADIWKMQFESYCEIVESVEGHSLLLPDNLLSLGEAIKQLGTLHEIIGESIDPTPLTSEMSQSRT